jgi:hypothetical protein
MVSLKSYMCFFSSAVQAYLEQREPISTLKNPNCRKYSFQKLTPFSQGNNVLEAAAYNKMVFFGKIHVCLHSAEQAYLEQRDPISTLKHIIWRKYFFENLSHLTGKQCTR